MRRRDLLKSVAAVALAASAPPLLASGYRSAGWTTAPHYDAGTIVNTYDKNFCVIARHRLTFVNGACVLEEV